jgi:hypothetical protein
MANRPRPVCCRNMQDELNFNHDETCCNYADVIALCTTIWTENNNNNNKVTWSLVAAENLIGD